MTIGRALHPEIETFVSYVGCVKSITFGWYIVFDYKYQALRGMSGEGNLAVDVTVPGIFGCKSKCLGRSDEAANFSVVKLRSRLVHVLMGGENITGRTLIGALQFHN